MTDEPDPGLDPIHDGIGKFIRAAVAMEETTNDNSPLQDRHGSLPRPHL